MVPYELIDHTADFGINVNAENNEILFTNAALAMYDLITDMTENRNNQSLFLAVTGADWPDLMVNWLREMLYLWNGEQKLVTFVTIIKISEYKINARVMWHSFDPDVDEIKTEIKAVTYHNISVNHVFDRWSAQIIFDI